MVLALALLAGGGKVPFFSLPDLDGNLHNLKEYLSRGPVLLNFWATWCSFCDQELDDFQAFWMEDTGRVRLLAVSWDSPRTASRVRSMARAHGWEFPILLDGTRQVGRSMGVFGLPTTFLIAPDGSVLGRWIGYHEENLKEIRKLLDSLQVHAPGRP